MTTIWSPALAPLSSSPRTTHASGSVKAACSSFNPSGTFSVFFATIRAGTLRNSA